MAIPRLDELGERLGIVLQDPEAIRQAFVHSSFLNENPERRRRGTTSASSSSATPSSA